MKELMKRAKSFITFDFPLQVDYINTQFISTHSRCQVDFPGWSTNATKQKVIAIYWLTHVLRHFAFLIGMAALSVLLMRSDFGVSYLFVIFWAGSASFPVLLLFHYWPNYSYDFLPKLETVKETYEHKGIEQLEKCRKTQLPNPTLILIHYALDIASNMNAMQSTEKFAGLLTKLYGVDRRSLKNNMDILIGSSIKKKNIKGRGQTEISNRFQEAYQFFEELNFSKGIDILKKLEARFSQF